MAYRDVIFREYDIRGIYEKEYDLDFVESLGKAFATLLIQAGLEPKISLGYDARLSSVEIQKRLSKTLLSSGIDIYQLGLITSPMSYFSNFNGPQVLGSIMITGSHNPPEYNGFKICLNRQTLFGGAIQKIKEIIQTGSFKKLDRVAEEIASDLTEIYCSHYQKQFNFKSSMPIILDCGNGACGVIARKMFEKVGLKPIILFEEPDGRFPNHHPDPTVEKNLVWLKKKVLETQALLGIGFDGDGDRIVVVDHTGRTLFGDELMALISQDILKKRPHSSIVADVKCSDRFFDFVEKFGGKPLMWKTGHSLVKEKIKEVGAPFGGELSGHIFFNDQNYGYDDAVYAALRVCQILEDSKKNIPELLAEFPSGFSTPEIRIDTTETLKHEIVSRIKDHFSKNSEYPLNLIDGVRISFKTGWALVRASNTQPVIVFRFEEKSSQNLQNRIEEFNNLLKDLLPEPLESSLASK